MPIRKKPNGRMPSRSFGERGYRLSQSKRCVIWEPGGSRQEDLGGLFVCDLNCSKHNVLIVHAVIRFDEVLQILVSLGPPALQPHKRVNEVVAASAHEPSGTEFSITKRIKSVPPETPYTPCSLYLLSFLALLESLSCHAAIDPLQATNEIQTMSFPHLKSILGLQSQRIQFHPRVT